MKFRAVFFDLDGTLLNTLDDLADSSNIALRENGLPTHPTEAYRMFVGNGMAKLIERACPAGSSPETLSAVRAVFDREYALTEKNGKTRPYPGTEALLSELSASPLSLAVVTNKADHAAQKLVPHHFPQARFDMIVGERSGIPVKPAPDMGLIACRSLSLTPSDVLFIGDSGVDISFASAAGFFAVGALWGFRSKDELIQNGASVTISHPSELPTLL